MCLNKQDAIRQEVMNEISVTLSESKQAMTRPFSTWQLREGWANLHSASEREQVPLWNSRHTSRVSHLVSRPMVILTAIRNAHKHWAVVEADGWKTVWWVQGWLIVMQEKNPQQNIEKTEAKTIQFFHSANKLKLLVVGVFLGLFISSSWEMWQLKFQ